MWARLTVIHKFMGNCSLSCSFIAANDFDGPVGETVYFPSSSDDFPPFSGAHPPTRRHGFMSNNGLFMLVHTGHTSAVPWIPTGAAADCIW